MPTIHALYGDDALDKPVNAQFTYAKQELPCIPGHLEFTGAQTLFEDPD